MVMACERVAVTVNPDELARIAGEEEGETSLVGLARAARRLGFRARAEEWTVGELFEHGAALAGRNILHFYAGHFVLLTGVESEAATVADPTGLKRAKTRFTREELVSAWSGKLLVLRGVPGGNAS